ncbi:Rhodanese-related sulfurtransferase [hydrothermal vent metagenome]|uniref:Rhodanese-related sulfurtransferase n=1 Tax=hydrothermal vent metagenome TaxID=652676 RepID=A0A3B0XAL1_9ZZZZ
MSQNLKTVTAVSALEICRQDPRTLLIDVRSSMEFLFVGHPTGAIHIPWIDEPEWVINKNFVTEIRKLALGGLKEDADDVSIILICRSGNRSEEAGKLLVESGIKNVCHIDEGFEGKLDDGHHRSSVGGWRFHGLPWEQC